MSEVHSKVQKIIKELKLLSCSKGISREDATLAIYLVQLFEKGGKLKVVRCDNCTPFDQDIEFRFEFEEVARITTPPQPEGEVDSETIR